MVTIDGPAHEPKPDMIDVLMALNDSLNAIQESLQQREYQKKEERRMLKAIRLDQKAEKRAHIAAMALQGILANPKVDPKHSALIVRAAVEQADALIAALDKNPLATSPTTEGK